MAAPDPMLDGPYRAHKLRALPRRAWAWVWRVLRSWGRS